MVFRPLLLAVTMAATLGACSPTIETRGALPDPDQLALVQPGRLNRDDIADMLGSPSSRSAFGDETWYYITSKVLREPFGEKELERQVVAIDFNENGIVSDVRTYGLDDGREVRLVGRETHTAGQDITILQQLLGNVGRFEGSSEPGTGR